MLAAFQSNNDMQNQNLESVVLSSFGSPAMGLDCMVCALPAKSIKAAQQAGPSEGILVG